MRLKWKVLNCNYHEIERKKCMYTELVHRKATTIGKREKKMYEIEWKE